MSLSSSFPGSASPTIYPQLLLGLLGSDYSFLAWPGFFSRSL